MTTGDFPDGFRPLGPAGELADDYVNPFYVEELKRRIAVARVDGELYAFDDLCPCDGDDCPLSAGKLAGRAIMCQCHGSEFDLATGEVRSGPATNALVTYEVRESDGEIQARA